MNILHEETLGDHRIRLIQDEHCDCNPRDWDNLGTMVCWHGNYLLGDVEEAKTWGTPARFQEWAEEMKPIILPIFLYDHSGICMQTVPFTCPWDSGQVGYIFCSLAKARKEYDCKQVTPPIRKKIIKILTGEVEVYNAHISGNCFGYDVTDPNGNHIDSCWGYHGYLDIDWEYALGEARTAVKHAMNSQVGAGI